MQVSKTMKSVKQALTERFYTWEDARQLAENDPEVDLASTTNPYKPSNYFEDDVVAAEATGEQKHHAEESAPGTISTSPKTPESQPVART